VARCLILTLLCAVWSLPVWAQGDPGGALSRPDRNSAGTPINQDYFVKDQYPGTLWLVGIVEAHHLNERVIEDFRAGRYSSMIGDLEYTLDRIPNHPRALMLIGSVAELTNQPGLAIPRFEQAIQLYPHYAITRAQYGFLLLRLGNPEDAVKELTRAVEIDPEMAQAHAWLAEALGSSGRLEDGQEAAERARQLGYTRTIPLPRPD